MASKSQIRPLDIKILQTLVDGRNVPTNIADNLDSHRNYISNRLQHLKQEGLIEHIGSKRTGLYEITPAGEQALANEHDPGISVDIQTQLST